MKNSFYFSHDYNARNDRLLVKLLMRHGVAGIGVFWCVVEMLYEENGYLLRTEYERISFELRTDIECIKSILETSELFSFDDDKFWSESVLERLELRNAKSEKARESVKNRWDKYERNTNVIQPINDSNTIKERKGKESILTWRNDFQTYLSELRTAYEGIVIDKDWIEERKRYHPNIDVLLSLEKSCVEYWSKEIGWKQKKSDRKSESINWKSTFTNALNNKLNHVYEPRK